MASVTKRRAGELEEDVFERGLLDVELQDRDVRGIEELDERSEGPAGVGGSEASRRAAARDVFDAGQAGERCLIDRRTRHELDGRDGVGPRDQRLWTTV